MLSGLTELRQRGTHSERHHWCMQNEQLMTTTLGIGITLAVGSVWFLNRAIWLFMVPLSMIAAAYVLPLLRTRNDRTRLREVGLWKIFLIAVVWSGITVILPAVHLRGLDQFSDVTSWQLAVERGIFILAITLPFDIRDLVNDAKKGVRTIPSVIGWKPAVWLSEVLMVVFLALVSLRLGIGNPLFIAYALSGLMTMTLLAVATPHRHDMYCSFWVEGTMMLQFAAVLGAGAFFP
jgi:4-hydroxybenzoate polyprenyltransferase